MNRFNKLWLIALASLGLAACTQVAPSAVPTPTAIAALPSTTPSFTPTLTPSHTPTVTPTPTATFTPTPTLHPMMIEAQRRVEYPGSEIVLEEELEPGSNYRRFYASYLSDGLKIYALLTIPNGERPATGWPVIVFNHGFIPPDVYRTTERYIAYVDNLARSGYIIFRSDYRGHDQSEGQATGAYSNPGYLSDVLNAVASLKKFPDADPQRIGMWGHSMGGYLTLRSMVIDEDIKVGVIWAGVVASYPDLFARGSSRPTPTGTPQFRGWRSAWVQEYGTREENPEFWDSISANAYLADISGPIQLHHGTADESVPLAASETLYAEMLAANQPVEFYTYEADNHNLSGFFVTAMTRTLTFFETYLK